MYHLRSAFGLELGMKGLAVLPKNPLKLLISQNSELAHHIKTDTKDIPALFSIISKFSYILSLSTLCDKNSIHSKLQN